MKRLEGMVALVTGAGTGLGRAICVAYAREGADVAVVYTSSRAGADETVRQVEECGQRGHAIQADGANVEDVRRMIRETVEHFGHIDIVVNNGSARNPGRLIGYALEDWNYVMNANVRGMFFAMKEAAAYMKEQGHGKIIHVSSIMGLRPSGVTRTAYVTSKRAIMAITRSGAKELGPYGIHVNCIIPGSFTSAAVTDNASVNNAVEERRNKIIALGRRAVPEEIQGIAVFLASHESDYVDGECYKIDGGWACGD